jgi:hypothetical protein
MILIDPLSLKGLYEETHDEAIHDDLVEALVPFIVKFWSDKQTNHSCVSPAMYYLYARLPPMRPAQPSVATCW